MTKRYLALRTLLAAAISLWTAYAACAEKPRPVKPTVYNGVSTEELLRVYKEAFLRAGFESVDVKTRREHDTRYETELYAVHSILHASYPERATLTIPITSSGTGGQMCSPCIVSYMTLELSTPEVRLPVYVLIMRAHAEVKARLGATFPL